MKFIFALLSILALAAATADVQLTNSIFFYEAGVATMSYLGIENVASSTLSSVSFTITPEIGSGLLIAYPNGAGSSSVGSAQPDAVGYGNYQVIASSGLYTALVNVSYTKSGVEHYSTATIIFDIYDEDDDGVDSRMAANENEIASAQGNDRADAVTARTVDIYTMNNGWTVQNSVATWVNLNTHTGSSGVTSVTFTIVPDSTNVAIVYASGAGNSLGSIAANTEKDTSFEIQGPTGSFNLNVTYKYKLSGGTTYKYYSNVISLSIADGSTDGSGRREFIDEDIEVVNAEKQPFQYTYVAATAAGVAAVAVVAIVGTVLYRKRYSGESSTSA